MANKETGPKAIHKDWRLYAAFLLAAFSATSGASGLGNIVAITACLDIDGNNECTGAEPPISDLAVNTGENIVKVTNRIGQIVQHSEDFDVT